MDDLIIFLIYLVIIVGGMVASALQVKKKKQQKSAADALHESDQNQEYNDHHDYGPFRELYDQQLKELEPSVHESIEYGPTLEEEGINVERSDSYEGMAKSYKSDAKIPVAGDSRLTDGKFAEKEKTDVQKWIEKYSALQHELEDDYSRDEISKSEIVSEEAAAEAASRAAEREPFLDLRKAIIYSEILKRREL
ncbi:MAG: hypothetical protein JXB19_02290 [Bacteroidales bacterium]|nr:hypothetical protein [Bacteroidales bacterium]